MNFSSYLIGYIIFGAVAIFLLGIIFTDFIEKLKKSQFENKKEKVKWIFKYFFTGIFFIGWLVFFYNISQKNLYNRFFEVIGGFTVLIGVPYLIEKMIKDHKDHDKK